LQRQRQTAPGNSNSLADAADGYERKSPRKKVLLRGKLVCDGTQLIDCTISDISVSGAGIRLPKQQSVPKQVFLIIMRDAIAHEAEVRWQKRSNLGLLFHRSCLLDGQLPADMEFLKKLWERDDFHIDGRGIRSLSSATLYKGIRISVVPVDGGFAAYARPVDCQADGGLNIGKQVMAEVHDTVDAALAAAKKAVDAGKV
jgi:hypothetical protein